MSNFQLTDERIDKLEVALIMIVNSLRASENGFVIAPPEALLNYLEKLILSRPKKKIEGG